MTVNCTRTYYKSAKIKRSFLLIRYVFGIIAIFILLQQNLHYMTGAVSFIPNASDVIAIVKEKHTANGLGYVTLHIISANNYKSMKNFMGDYIGKDITVIVSDSDLTFFDKKEVNVLVSVSVDKGGEQSFNVKIKPDS
jgi:hypothetical protein